MPKGQHPFNQLLKGRRKRSKGSLEEALRECWLLVRVCAAARDHAMEQADFDEVHRFVQLEVSALRAFATLSVPGDLEQRIRVLELNGRNGHHPAMMTQEDFERMRQEVR